MDPFDLAQDFIECAVTCHSQEVITTRFAHVAEHLGFEYWACCSHVDPSNPPEGAVVLHNYPRAWEHECYDRGVCQVDPVLQYAERTLIPFHWDDPAFLESIDEHQRAILMRARACGLLHGFTVPIHLPWSATLTKASCSVATNSAKLAPECYQVIQLTSLYLYNAVSHHARPTHRLNTVSISERERQCLELVARGKSDWIIGQLLNISEHTVHRHIETAKRRLGVSTRVQVILRAIELRQISFGDVIRSDNGRGAR